jgi:hypothetical protein
MWISLTVIWNPEKAKSAEALRTSAHSMGLSTELRSSTFLQKETVTKLTLQLMHLRACISYSFHTITHLRNATKWLETDLKRELVGRSFSKY